MRVPRVLGPSRSTVWEGVAARPVSSKVAVWPAAEGMAADQLAAVVHLLPVPAAQVQTEDWTVV